MARDNHSNLDLPIMITLLTIKLHLPGCSSLKEKRGRLQPILSQIRREFHLAVSEVGLQDVWQSAWIAGVLVSNSGIHNARVLEEVIKYIESRFPDEEISEFHLDPR